MVCVRGTFQLPISILGHSCTEHDVVEATPSSPDKEKRSICFQTRASGISVAQVARRYALNANLIFKWLKDPRFQSDELETEESRFLPVEISPEPEAALRKFIIWFRLSRLTCFSWSLRKSDIAREP
jgi:hypothetical protein